MIYVLYVVTFCLATSVDKPCLDLQKTGEGMDAYVSSGAWHCASKLITEAHAGHVPEKTTVFFSARSAATRVKKEAEAILRLLDKKFAIPAPISCAYRAKQNETHFMVVSRFAKIWDGQSAKWSSYSTKGGQGQVVHSEDLPFEHINMNATHAEMTITGEILNRRYIYDFQHKFFDYIIPEESSYQVAFRDAQGSLQMSTGAKLPELHWTFRKRLPRWWPRLSGTAQGEQGYEDMEAFWEDNSEHFNVNSQDMAMQSPLTCAASFYCSSTDTCVDNCAACVERPISAASDRVCHRQNAPKITDISLWDTDGKKGIISGTLTWNVDLYDTQSVEVDATNGAGTTILTGTVRPAQGYELRPSKVVSVKLTTIDYKGVSSAPVVFSLVDNIAATGSVTAAFTDEDLRPGFIAGSLKVEFRNEGTFTDVVAFYNVERNSQIVAEKIDLEWIQGKVRRGEEVEYYISELPSVPVFTLFLSNRGSLQESGYDIAVVDAHRPAKPSVNIGLDWSRETPNDLDIEIRISGSKNNKDTHRLLWGNGDLIADLGPSKLYRYQGPMVHPTIMAEASNAFGVTLSDSEKVENIENGSAASHSEEKRKEEL